MYVCILKVDARSWAKITLSSLCCGTDIGEYKQKDRRVERINGVNEWVPEWKRGGGKVSLGKEHARQVSH